MNRQRGIFPRRSDRRGSIVVLAAVMMILMTALVAFAVDLGYLLNGRTELQRSADAAAIAAAWKMIDEEGLTGDPSMTQSMAEARALAAGYAGLNEVCRSAPQVDQNPGNSESGDVLIGRLDSLSDQSLTLNTMGPAATYNAVRVRVRRTAEQNGVVPFFFARFMGFDGSSIQAEATAAIVRDIAGFQIPAGGGNLDILPFAIDEDTWNALLASQTSDDWAWNETTETVTPGSDGIREVNLYPQATGSPGNRGTVDIGSSSNSSNDIKRQILSGVSADDLQYHGGKLEFDEYGELLLNADTGISAGFKAQLEQIKGQPRTIPVFRSISGNGNNANYTIVKWVGVRILEVRLTGSNSSKRVIVQPAIVVTDGIIPGTVAGTSDFIYSRPVLVR